MAFYSGKHRTICAVLEDILEIAVKSDNLELIKLTAEAKTYAISMSNKLLEHKRNEIKEENK